MPKLTFLIEEGDTVGMAYFLLDGADTLNYIDHQGIKNGYWIEYQVGGKSFGHYDHGLKDQTWEYYIPKEMFHSTTQVYEKGWLVEETRYGSDLDSGNQKYIGSKLALSNDSSQFILTTFHSNGKIWTKEYFSVPNRSEVFNGFNEGMRLKYFIKKDIFD